MAAAFLPPLGLQSPSPTLQTVATPFISTRRPTKLAPRRPRRHGAAAARCLWVERAATVVIEATREETYDSYIDLEAMPRWSPWLKSVIVDEHDPDVSKWTLAARGITISWKARNTEVRRGEIIAWKSLSGLPNRGRVLFEPEDGTPFKSKITLAIEFDVPPAIARAIDNDFIGRFVESTLHDDLQRFRKIALAERRRARRNGVGAKEKQQ